MTNEEALRALYSMQIAASHTENLNGRKCRNKKQGKFIPETRSLIRLTAFFIRDD
jgi:hypothetical protein